MSAGGTSTWDITSTFAGVTEIQPGSYIFMDTSYKKYASTFENALFLLATVISRPARGRAIVDVGVSAMSTSEGMPAVQWPNGATLVKLDQEHGHLALECESETLRPGDRVAMLRQAQRRKTTSTFTTICFVFGTVCSNLSSTSLRAEGSGEKESALTTHGLPQRKPGTRNEATRGCKKSLRAKPWIVRGEMRIIEYAKGTLGGE